MKNIVAVIFAFILLLARDASAQEAIPVYSRGGVVGYSLNGAGFEFMPTVPIEVTALGFNGEDLSNSPYQVSIFNNAGSLLSTAQVNNGDTLYNETYYQSVTPFILPAFSTNYIEGIEANTNLWVGAAVGSGIGGSFSVNSDLNYLGAVNDFVAGLPTSQDGDYFFVDENFQFVVVPEPSDLSLGIVSLLGLAWLRSGLKREA